MDKMSGMSPSSCEKRRLPAHMFLVLYLQLVKHKKNKNFVKRKFNFQLRTGTVAVLLDWRKTQKILPDWS